MARQKTSLRPGTVAILDALGFKGIWGRHKVPAILKKLRTLLEAMAWAEKHWGDEAHLAVVPNWSEGPIENAHMTFQQSALTIRFLSDTIVVGAHAESEDEKAMAYSLWNVTRVCSLINYVARRPPDPLLLYRGSIACGKFLIDDNFLIGPAIDEAAALFERGIAACTWLAPSACSQIDKLAAAGQFDKYPKEAYLLDFFAIVNQVPVPLHQGESYDTWSVVPFHGRYEIGREEVLAAFGPAGVLDIELKRQATERWLSGCEARVRTLLGAKGEKFASKGAWANQWLGGDGTQPESGKPLEGGSGKPS